MRFSAARFLIIAFVGLPVGFILAALCFAIAGSPIVAREVFPCALGLALAAGSVAGLRGPPR